MAFKKFDLCVEDLSSRYLSGERVADIAKSHGCSTMVIRDRLREGGCKMRNSGTRMMYDQDFFEVIDSEDKAYWMGYIVADGSVGKYGVEYRVSVATKDSDEYHIRRLADAVGFKGTIKKTGGAYGIAAGSPKCSHLVFKRKKMYLDLVSHGVLPRKSKDGTCPKVEGPIATHFWRGVIDGDGSVFFSDGVPYISLCGSNDVVSSFREWCIGQGASAGINVVVTKAGLSQIQYGRKAARLITRALYRECSISLDRKQETADLF